MRFKALVVVIGMALLSIGSGAQAQPRSEWELLGEERVGIGADRDVINLKQDENFYRNRSYRKLRFVAEGGDVKLNGIRLVYINGAAEDLPVNRELKSGQQVDIDLRGERSYLRRIEMSYGSKFGISIGLGGIRLNEATMKVFGENVRAAPRPVTPVGGNWAIIGTERFDRTDDRVRIRVGRKEGRIGQIAFQIDGDTVDMRQMLVRFANGETQAIQVNQRVQGGDRSQPVDLDGDRRVIEEVTVVLEPRRRPGQETITLFGTERPGNDRQIGLAAIAPPVEANVQLIAPRQPTWQSIATERFDRRASQVRLRIPRRDGRVSQIALAHQGDQVDLREMIVRFSNGEQQTFKLDQEIRDGEQTTPIDLDGGIRSVDEVTVIFYPRLRPGQVSLSLQGQEFPGPAINSEWVPLGSQTLGFQSEREAIRVGQPESWYRDRGFDKLHFVAERNDVNLRGVRVVYLNGQAEDYRFDRMIESGGVLSVDLPGRRSYVKEIELLYRGRDNVRGQAVVSVYGEPARR
jgi:hypothetical protein